VLAAAGSVLVGLTLYAPPIAPLAVLDAPYAAVNASPRAFISASAFPTAYGASQVILVPEPVVVPPRTFSTMEVVGIAVGAGMPGAMLVGGALGLVVRHHRAMKKRERKTKAFALADPSG